MRKFTVIILVFILLLLSGCVTVPETIAEDDERVFRFGEITVCMVNSEISFSATVKKDEGWVQHLLYLHGYQWLKDQSAIVSSASLSQLQHGIAVLDWELWDELWQGIESERAFDVKVYIEYEGRRVEAYTLIYTQDLIHIGDIVFLGSPYFDAAALGTAAQVDCVLCPVFPLEQEALQEIFVRENGESGYKINKQEMFDVGSKVGIILKISSN